MSARYSKFIRTIHLLGDIILLNFSFIAFYFIYSSRLPTFSNYIPLLLFFNLFWIVAVSLTKLYTIHRTTRTEEIILNLFKAILLHILLVFTFIVVLKFYDLSRKHLLITYLLFGGLIFLWRMAFIKALKIYRKSGFNYRKVIIVGAGPMGTAMRDFFNSDLSYGYHFIGFFDDNPEKYDGNGQLVRGKVEDVKSFALKNKVDEIYWALPDAGSKKARSLVNFAEKNLIRFKIIPQFLPHIPKKVKLDFYDSIPIILIRKEPLELFSNRVLKRIFDICFSFFIIVLIFPWLFPMIGLLIKLSSWGPVFFIQKRSGERNKMFNCIKFRTMYVNKEADVKQATHNDNRVTPIGKYVRRTNLDELPQFFNVLKGDMSVIGPRPHMLKHTEEYSKIIDKYMVRHLVKPGITGWAQVNGFRGQTINPKKMQKRVKHDVWYIENWSFLLDLKITLKTVGKMLNGDKNAV